MSPKKTPLRAKIFRNGGSQAVRLPKECRFIDQREVVARREGRRVILEPVDEWSDAFRSCLGAWTDELARLKQEKLQDPFA
jgi:antitoxin VapB